VAAFYKLAQSVERRPRPKKLRNGLNGDQIQPDGSCPSRSLPGSCLNSLGTG